MTTTAAVSNTKFQTIPISSIEDRDTRIKQHFIALRKIEILIFQDPDVVHKKIYVEIDDGSLYLMDMSALYINLVLWLFNVTYKVPITKEDIHDFTNINAGVFIGVMDTIISKFLKLGCDLDIFPIIGTVKEKIVKIGRFYGSIMANTFSLYDVMALESRSPQFSELFNNDLDQNSLSTHEIELYLDNARARLYKIIIDDGKSALYPYISAGIVNQTQMGQMFIAVGSRNDIDKSILPVIIKGNWVRGMQTNAEYFVESVQTRNGIIQKKEAVPDSGYLSRQVNIACLPAHLDHRIYDCGSKHYIEFFVADEKHLKIIEGKYMLVNDNPHEPILKEVSEDDYHLIGKMIKFRSHTKCITGHQLNKVCCVCFGNKHISLKNARIGGLVSIKVVNPVTQLGLAGKHASQTKSEDITGDVFNRYFSVSKTSIFPRKEVCSHKRCQLLIPLEIANDIRSSDSVIDGDDEGFDFSKSVNVLFVVENGVLRGMDLEDKNFFLNISDNLVSMLSNNTGDIVRADDVVKSIAEIESTEETVWATELQDMEFVSINFADIDPTESLFNVKLLTEEVSRYLKIMKSIINGAKTASYSRPEDAIVDLIDVIFKANIKSQGLMVHIETLFMNLIRPKGELIERADYSTDIEPPIQIIKLSQAIQKSDLFSGIVFEDLKRQFESADVLKKKSPGIFDIFFKNSEFKRNGEEFKRTRPYLFTKREKHIIEEPVIDVGKKRKFPATKQRFYGGKK